jgi:Acetyl-CoA dehydrogenase C-terminal like
MAEKLADNLTMLRASTHEIQKWRASDIARCSAVATDYLRQFGLVALGAVWLRMAEAALRVRASRPAMTTFCDAKLQTARHYFARLLPEAALRHDAVLCGYADIINPVAEAS